MVMRGVQRTVAVFECFNSNRLSLTLQQIADGIGLAKSTTFRIVQSLEATGYLIRLEDQRYCLSFRFTRLGGLVMSTLSIRQVARPMMQQLALETNETITLNVANENDRTCIDVIDTPAPLMSLARPGQHVPLDHKGATAKTLMAHLPDAERARIVAHAARTTRRKRDEILAELARIRKDGYCLSHGERVLGLSAVAAPIGELDGFARYCVTITAPTVRLTPRIDTFIRALRHATAEISLRWGADPSGSAVKANAQGDPRRIKRNK